MIEFKTGDIFTSDAEALVNSVNCVGVMGRGVALAFKKKFTDNYAAYRARCEANEMQPGKVFIYERHKPTLESPSPRYIINFPSKRHWRSKSRRDDVEAGLDDLAAQIQRLDIQSVAMPAIASDLGGLPWTWVREQIETKLAPLADEGVHVTVFEPGSGAPDGRPNPSRSAPPMDRFGAALVHIVDIFSTASNKGCVTAQDVHSAMYLLQESGNSLGLEFEDTAQGPTSANVSKKLRSLRPHYVTFNQVDGKDNTQRVSLVPGAACDAHKIVRSVENMQLRFERVMAVAVSVDSLPLLVATVQGANATNPYAAKARIVEAVQSRDQGDIPLKKTHIAKAITALRKQGILPHYSRKPNTGKQLALPLQLENA